MDNFAKTLPVDAHDPFRRVVSVAIGDWFLQCATLLFSKMIFENNNKSKVYQYYYEAMDHLFYSWAGSAHGTDLLHWFGAPYKFPYIFFTEFNGLIRNITFTDADKRISDDMMRIISYFTTHG